MGTGSDMSEKILIYNAIVNSLQARSTVPNEINVAEPRCALLFRSGRILSGIYE